MRPEVELTTAPQSVQLVVENRCYMGCRFCDQPSSLGGYLESILIPDDIGQAGEWFKQLHDKERRIVEIVGLLRRWGVERLTLTGGEPTLFGGIIPLMAVAKRLGFREVSLATSGQATYWPPRELSTVGGGILTPNFLDRVEPFIGVLKLPLHGSRDTHNKLTGGIIGGFDGVFATLVEYARHHRDHLRAEVTCVVCEENRGDIQEVLGICLDCGVSQLTLSEVQRRGWGRNFAGSVPAEEIEAIKTELLETRKEEIQKTGLKIIVRKLQDTCILVFPNGNIFIGDQRLGNLLSDDINEIWKNSSCRPLFEESYRKLHS